VLIQNSPAIKSVQPQENYCEKDVKSEDGGQEMAVMVG